MHDWIGFIIRLIKTFTIILLTSSFSSSSSSSSSFTTKTSSSNSNNKHIPYNQPDRWVSASPFAVAAVCRDGFAFVTAHTAPSLEPLLMPTHFSKSKVTTDHKDNENNENNDNNNHDRKYDSKQDENMSIENNNEIFHKDTLESSNNKGGNSSHTFVHKYPSLPSTYRGPSRIERIDGRGTCLLSCGWKTDCTYLAEHCRQLISEDMARYGSESGTSASDGGRVLADEAALWMAQCAFSGRVRALSCVGLLACCHTEPTLLSNHNQSGSLWLVDATGAYQVRALAIGNGASFINKQLCNIAFHEVSKEEGVQLLIKAISSSLEDDTLSIQDDGHDDDIKWNLPEGSYLESGVVDFKSQSLKRIRDPYLKE